MADWSIYTSELIYAYLHGHPFLAGSPPVPLHAQAELAKLDQPQPSPWRSREIQAAASPTIPSTTR
jgi:hypothetical protein